MIVLKPHDPLILPVVPKMQWRTPSLAQPKDVFGNENQTRFRIRGRTNDGYVRWVGWFDDRDDADAFLWALVNGKLRQERSLWDFPTPAWRPDLWPGLAYEFATVVFLTTTTGSNQTYTSPVDWNNASNTIELLAGGGGGNNSNGFNGTGGGGGEYGKTTNFTFATPGTTTATYQLGAGGGGASNGGNTWFNGTTQGGATLGAIHGNAGAAGSGPRSGGSGGTGGVGTTHFAGGRGGNLTGSGAAASGGGGAAGSTGAGNQGVDSSSSTIGIATAGGSGDAGSGGAGGTAGNVGGNGTEWDASHGSGGGGGGTTSGGGKAGGNYGGGGSGSQTSSAGGAGIQGIIVVTYTPKKSYGFNQPMLGM